MSRLSFQAGTVSLEVEGDDDLVREAFVLVKESFPKGPIMPVSVAPSDVQTLTKPLEESEPDIREFYQARTAKPRNDMQRVVILAQFAKEARGIAEISEKEVLPLFQEAGDRKLPGNLGNTLRNAARKQYGWVESVAGRRGYYKVTNAGYRLVHHDLVSV